MFVAKSPDDVDMEQLRHFTACGNRPSPRRSFSASSLSSTWSFFSVSLLTFSSKYFFSLCWSSLIRSLPVDPPNASSHLKQRIFEAWSLAPQPILRPTFKFVTPRILTIAHICTDCVNIASLPFLVFLADSAPLWSRWLRHQISPTRMTLVQRELTRSWNGHELMVWSVLTGW